MKFLTFGAFLLVLSFSSLFAEGDPVIPSGVRYKPIDGKLNEKIRSDLSGNFADGPAGVMTLFQQPCICGPAYWSIIKTRSDAKFKNPIPSSFKIPNTTTGKTNELKGATFKNYDDLAILANMFANDVGSNPVIRKLYPQEISLFWAMIPFDIEEPLYILENKNRHFLLCLSIDKTTGKYFPFWIDEISSYSMTANK